MSWTRLALVVCFAALAFTAWPRHPVVVDTHGPTRQLMIGLTLARTDDAAVILGDSIVEASTLPRSLCGHAIVNAGIGGASTESDLGSLLVRSLAGKRAAMVVIALGTNDAAIPNPAERFRSNYRALFRTVTGVTPRMAALAIPPPEAGLSDAGKVSTAAIDDYNAILPELAREAVATFIPLPAMPAHHTADGIHLNAAGYAVWDQAILGAIDAALCKSG